MEKTFSLKIFVLIFCFVLLGCKKEDDDADTPINFRVYGTVCDRTTGEPVRGAKVTFFYGINTPGLGTSSPSGIAGSCVSGYDGMYEMSCSATENLINENHHIYTLKATCYGHSDYSEEVTIMESEGAAIHIDILF